MSEIMQNDRHEIAEKLHSYVMKGAYVSALSLKIIFDNGFFRELGFETQKEYIETCLPFGEPTAYKYVKVASIFGTAFGISFNFNEIETSFSTVALAKLSPKIVEAKAEKVWELGIHKLYTIAAKVTPDQFFKLMTHGYLEYRPGHIWLSHDELLNMSSKELAQWFKGAELKSDMDTDIDTDLTPKPAWVPVGKEVLKTAKYLKTKLETLANYSKPEIARAAGYEPNARLTEFNLELEDITNTLDSLLERLQFINQEVAS